MCITPFTKKQLEKLGFRFTHVPTFRYVEIVFPCWRGHFKDNLRVQLQNNNTQFVVNRACQYGWKNGVDHLAVFKMGGTGIVRIRKVFDDSRKVISKYARADPKYADMIAWAILCAKDMIK